MKWGVVSGECCLVRNYVCHDTGHVWGLVGGPTAGLLLRVLSCWCRCWASLSRALLRASLSSRRALSRWLTSSTLRGLPGRQTSTATSPSGGTCQSHTRTCSLPTHTHTCHVVVWLWSTVADVDAWHTRRTAMRPLACQLSVFLQDSFLHCIVIDRIICWFYSLTNFCCLSTNALCCVTLYSALIAHTVKSSHNLRVGGIFHFTAVS